jgi:hypothetical protein
MQKDAVKPKVNMVVKEKRNDRPQAEGQDEVE